MFNIATVYKPRVQKKDRIAVCVWNERRSDKIINELTRIIKELVHRKQEILLVSFCEYEGDLFTCKKINEQLNNNCGILNYNGRNLCKIIDVLASSKGVIGCRFHSIVLSLTLGVPVFPICYGIKSEMLLRDSAYKGDWDVVDNIESITAERILSQILKNTSISQEYMEKSIHQFDQFDNWIKKNRYI